MLVPLEEDIPPAEVVGPPFFGAGPVSAAEVELVAKVSKLLAGSGDDEFGSVVVLETVVGYVLVVRSVENQSYREQSSLMLAFCLAN